MARPKKATAATKTPARRGRPPKPRVVEAVGVASHSAQGVEHARGIEEAMVGALQACQQEGITDPAVQRDRMLAARSEFLAG